jgi:hypothetical protein
MFGFWYMARRTPEPFRKASVASSEEGLDRKLDDEPVVGDDQAEKDTGGLNHVTVNQGAQDVAYVLKV